MSTLSIIAMAVAVLALVGLAYGMPDPWFLGLLSLACMLGGLDAAYRELRLWALAFLISGTMLALSSVVAAFKGTDRKGG